MTKQKSDGANKDTSNRRRTEETLIRARAMQNDKDKKVELERDQRESQEWDKALTTIRQIDNEFDR